MIQNRASLKITPTNRLAQIAAYATECGFLRRRYARYAKEGIDLYQAAKAETLAEVYEAVEKRLTKILLQ